MTEVRTLIVDDSTVMRKIVERALRQAGLDSMVAASLNDQSRALDQEASGVTSQVNALTGAIARLNQQIQTSSPNADAGTLEDQRNQDISQLSQLIGINRITTENNGLSLTTTSGQLLVSEGTSYPLSAGMIGGVTHVFSGTTDLTAQLASGGGQLGGFLTARDQDIPFSLASLDQIAYSVSTSVNTLNNAGVDLNGATGTVTAPLNIFSAPTAVTGSALQMSVVMTDPGQIAAAGAGMGTGDNANAVAMAALATQSIAGGQTPTNYFSNFVSNLGSTVSGVQADNAAQNASVAQLQTQNNALSSVNLNDEAAAMSTLQNSYQAASQVFNILNTIMASALNLGEQTAVS